MIKSENEFKLTVVHFTLQQVHVPDAHLRMDLPLNKNSAGNLDWAAGPLGRWPLSEPIVDWAAGLLLAKAPGH